MKLLGFEIKRLTPFVDATRGFMSTIFGDTAGVVVNETTALSLSAYWAGVRRISESVAMLPIDVFRKQGDTREKVNHKTEYILNAEANLQTIAFDYTQMLITSAINHGNGLAIIERDGFGNPTGLVNVRKNLCEPIELDKEVVWNVKIDDTTTLRVFDRDMINLRGFGTHPVIGLSAIKIHAQNLGLSIAAQKYGSDFYTKGTRIDGFLAYDGKLETDTKKKIADSWRSNYGQGGSGGTAILDAGIKYERLGLPPEDAQFIETRKFQKNEVATILGLPPYMVNDLDGGTFSNIEHQGIEFVTYGIGGWIEKIEQEYRRKLLKENEKSTHYFKHNINRLLRTDVKAKAEYYRLMTDIGVYSINDVRELEDENPVANGDSRYVQLNRIPIEQIETYYAKDRADSGT